MIISSLKIACLPPINYYFIPFNKIMVTFTARIRLEVATFAKINKY